MLPQGSNAKKRFFSLAAQIGRYRIPVFAAKVKVFSVIVFLVLSGGVLATLNPAPASAVTSSNLNFQARLLQPTGALVADGTYNIQFNIYSVSSGGSTLWTESRLNNAGQGVNVKNGYLSVNLGSITAFPATIDWDQELWLGMTVRGTGSCVFGACTPADAEMSPRFKLTAVPYSFIAARALGVASNNTNSASTHSATVSVTTGNAAGATSNSGNLTVDTGTATGTTGTITIAAANASALTIGRVGLTTTNAGDLTVTGAGTFNGNLTVGDAIGDTVTINSGAWTFANDTTIALTGGVNGLNFDNDTLSIDATNDRIGIGTAAPSQKLEVSGNIKALEGYSMGSITGSGIQNTLLSQNTQAAAANTGSAIRFSGTATDNLQGRLIYAWEGAANTDSYFALETRASGAVAERLRVTSTGALAVNGASVTIGTASTTNGTLVFQNSTNAFTSTITASGITGSSKTITLPNETGTVCTTGSICSGYASTAGYATISLNNIASTNLNAALNVTSGNLALQTTTSGNITLTPAASSGLVNVLTGNLQVGNGTPGVTLNGEDVYIEGTLEVDGAQQFDGALVANSTATFNGGLTVGDASGDTVTVNAASWTFANDTNFTLSGGVNGLSFDTSTLSVDATNDRVGLGTTAPSVRLHVVGAGSAGAVVEALRLDNSEGAFGAGAGTGLGFYYTSSGKHFGSINTLAYAGDGGKSDMTFSVRTSEAISEKMRIQSDGDVGIGTTNPTEKLEVNGNVKATKLYMTGSAASASVYSVCVNGTTGELEYEFNASCTVNSDSRLKTNITTIGSALDKLSLIRGVTYNWADQSAPYPQDQQVGVIAQDVLLAFPQLVGTSEVPFNGTSGTYYTVNYQGLIGPTIQAVNELKVITDNLSSRITAVESGNFSGNLTVSGNTSISGSLTVTGTTNLTNLKVGGTTEVANLKVNGKIITYGNTPTVVLGTATTGDGSSYSIEGNDTAGSITINTGAAPTAGEQATVIFVTPFTTTPRITLTSTTEAAGNISYYITKSGTEFRLHFTTPPEASNTYSFDYQVLQ